MTAKPHQQQTLLQPSCGGHAGRAATCAADEPVFCAAGAGRTPGWCYRVQRVARALLLFCPWFVEMAFGRWAARLLCNYDTAGLLVSTSVWLRLAWVAARQGSAAMLVLAVPGLALVLAMQALAATRRATFMRHRRPLILTLRGTGLLLAAVTVGTQRLQPNTGPQTAALLTLLIRSGAAFHLSALMVIDTWPVVAASAVVSAGVLAAAAPHSCRLILSDPHPAAGWRAAAAWFDRAALRPFGDSLAAAAAGAGADAAGAGALDEAACAAALTTSQAVVACLVVYLVLSLERCVRSRYKQQLPPAVAAMQQHVYQLPLGLALAEGGVLVYCCAAVTWLAAGAGHGLVLHRGA